GEAHDRPDMIGNLCRLLAQYRVAHLGQSLSGKERGQGEKRRERFHAVQYIPRRQATITRMGKTGIFCACLLGLFAAFTPMLHAVDCAAMKQLKLPDTTITSAERLASGDLNAPGVDK